MFMGPSLLVEFLKSSLLLLLLSVFEGGVPVPLDNNFSISNSH